MTKRTMTVTRTPGLKNDQVPMIRISNKFLLDCNFTVGTKITVEYRKDEIIIKKI